MYSFHKFETIRFFTKNIYDDKITLSNADKDQENW